MYSDVFFFSANTISKGGFLAGLIIPHQNGYAIAVVEKLEDLVLIIFLPLVSWFHQQHEHRLTGML